MQRRELVQAITWTACGSCLGFGVAAVRPVPRASVPIVLDALGVFALGTARLYPEHGVAAVNLPEGLALVSARCTHLGCELCLAGDQLVCPCHGGRFSLRGDVLAGPPRRPLPWYDGGVNTEGQVYFFPSHPAAGRRVVRV
jgi:nitrite reductase/ring-hydroxylating ferredoxin subunit